MEGVHSQYGCYCYLELQGRRHFSTCYRGRIVTSSAAGTRVFEIVRLCILLPILQH